jgi:ABC-2 type transport system ATP-binding protein
MGEAQMGAGRIGATIGIEATGLTRAFGKDVRAVDGIDLSIERGEIYGFLGPNGAGKSTTVHLLTTLLPLTGGRARVGGYDVTRQPGRVREIIGVAMQDIALDPVLTGLEHVKLQAALHGLSRAERVSRGGELIAAVGLTAVAGRRTSTYSGGMKRRLELALALLHRPSVLFLDEPTNGLDVPSREALWEQVRKLAHEDGVTVFLTTQYLEEADQLADRVGIMDSGRIVAEASPAALKAEIGQSTIDLVPADTADLAAMEQTLAGVGTPVASRPGTLAVRVGNPTGALVDIVGILRTHGLGVDHIGVRAPTLNDVFLAKTGRLLEGAAGEPEEAVA